MNWSHRTLLMVWIALAAVPAFAQTTQPATRPTTRPLTPSTIDELRLIQSQVQEITRTALDAGLWILSDELYGKLVYDGATHHSPAAVPGAQDQVLVVTGGTKTHSLTGWRIGFLAGPEAIVQAAGRLQSQAIGNPSSISQAAGASKLPVTAIQAPAGPPAIANPRNT